MYLQDHAVNPMVLVLLRMEPKPLKVRVFQATKVVAAIPPLGIIPMVVKANKKEQINERSLDWMEQRFEAYTADPDVHTEN